MRIVRSNLATATICSLVGIIGIAAIIGAAMNNASTSALSYSTASDVSFTFAPTLSIGLSTDSLSIDNLVPGNISDSNSVKVTVSSNTPYGYVLSASVGSSDSTSAYYNTSNLVHEDSTVNNAFTSIDTSASLASLTTDNTWGYSTSLDNGTTWSTYSGLPSTTTKPLLDISDPAAPSTIDFKIAAKSSTTQASGTYNNIITFYAVGKPKPPDYMQDTATIKAELQNVGDEMQVMDARDGNIYWIAKQADGNIWMTQNLDLCIGCEGTTTLTSQNTDLNESGSGAYVEGYTNADGLIVWSPAYTSVTSRTTFISNDQIRPALPYSSDGGDVNPYSVEGGDVYIYPENTGTSTIYNSMDKCTTAGHTSENCLHFHRGNYYNWSAAIASNDSADLATQYSVAGNSICPSGWRLPKARSASTQTATTNEFGQLFYASGVTSSLTATSYASSKMLLFDSPLYFTRSSSVSADFWSNRGSYGDYLSSTVLDSSRIYYLSFSGSNINSAFGVYARASGNTVRCLVK